MSIVIRPYAASDLDRIANYLDREREGTGGRFLIAAQQTFQVLERMPGIGTAVGTANSTLAGLRQITVRRFRKYLVFYLPLADGIDIVRVLHGARDIPPIIEQE